jgi:hypothetical protein
MAGLLIILVPVAALLIYAVVFDIRRRRRGTLVSHDLNASVFQGERRDDPLIRPARERGWHGR